MISSKNTRNIGTRTEIENPKNLLNIIYTNLTLFQQIHEKFSAFFSKETKVSISPNPLKHWPPPCYSNHLINLSFLTMCNKTLHQSTLKDLLRISTWGSF